MRYENKIDELNKLDLTKYFQEMNLPKGNIARREELADMLVDFFMFYMVELQDLVKSNSDIPENRGSIDEFKTKMTENLNQALNDYGFNFERYFELKTYSIALIDEITDTTIERIDTPYFTSEERVKSIAADHTNSVYNFVDYADAKRNDYKHKQWIAIEDELTRQAHYIADNQIVGIDEMFEVGGEQMRFPHDPNASLQNIARCRCTCIYTK